MRDRYLAIDGIRTHLLCDGHGPALVLIHGLGGPLMWQRVVKPLSAAFHVIVLDLPGFGHSDCPPRELCVEEYADFVRHAIDALGITSVTIVGISYGGQIAATFASRYPECVDRLILVASTGFLKSFLLSGGILSTILSKAVKHTILRSRRLTCLFGSMSFYKLANRPAGFCAEFFRQISQVGRRDAWLSAVKNIYAGQRHFASMLPSISCPTLILWGEHDRTVPLSHALEFQRRIPGSVLRTFSRCAHSVPLDQPAEFCHQLFSFVDSTYERQTSSRV